jgi:hypothetical protein
MRFHAEVSLARQPKRVGRSLADMSKYCRTFFRLRPVWILAGQRRADGGRRFRLTDQIDRDIFGLREAIEHSGQ